MTMPFRLMRCRLPWAARCLSRPWPSSTSGRVSRLIIPATGLAPAKPYSFQRSETFCSTARSMKISLGLFFHSNGVQASRMMRLMMSRASIGRPGSSGVERPRSMICAERLGSKRVASAHQTRSQSSASMSWSTMMTPLTP